MAMNLAVIGWVIHHYWTRFLRRYDAVRVALQVERRHPDLKSLLVSYVQLHGKLPDGSQASPRLIEAMRSQAVEMTAPLDFREIISYVELKRILVVSLCVIAFAAAVSVNWTDYVHVLIARLFGGRDLRYPTAHEDRRAGQPDDPPGRRGHHRSSRPRHGAVGRHAAGPGRGRRSRRVGATADPHEARPGRRPAQARGRQAGQESQRAARAVRFCR